MAKALFYLACVMDVLLAVGGVIAAIKAAQGLPLALAIKAF